MKVLEVLVIMSFDTDEEIEDATPDIEVEIRPMPGFPPATAMQIAPTLLLKAGSDLKADLANGTFNEGLALLEEELAECDKAEEQAECAKAEEQAECAKD